MNHAIIAPVVLPAFAAVCLLLGGRLSHRARRWIAGGSIVALLGIAIALVLQAAGGPVQVYRVGAWPAPYGIVLVLDRLSALMVLLTAVVALFSHLYAINGHDLRGANYHALLQLQLMGLCGAFLTGDLFNLFVFFEVLLIASYGLLLHGGGRDRVRAGLHYVVFNLVTSALFLIGVGTLYGVTGTLNMADLSLKVAAAAPADAALLRSAGLVLLVVFGVKAAILPLYFWLPSAYASATAPVAALFAIMTKVGVYSILRVTTLIYGPDAGGAAGAAAPWLLVLGLLTLTTGTLGVMAARRLGGMVAYLVVASVGTMITAVALGRPDSVSAALYYMVHSTVVLAALFLLADLIARQRDETGSRLVPATAVAQPALLGSLFLVGGVAVAGLPPLSGFVGKALVLRSALGLPSVAWVYGVVLTAGLVTIVALARAGSTIFWNVGGGGPADEPAADAGAVELPLPALAGEVLPAAGLLALTVALTLAAGPVVDFTGAAATQLLEPDEYIRIVLEPVETGGGHEEAGHEPDAEPEGTVAAAEPASGGTER